MVFVLDCGRLDFRVVGLHKGAALDIEDSQTILWWEIGVLMVVALTCGIHVRWLSKNSLTATDMEPYNVLTMTEVVGHVVLTQCPSAEERCFIS